MRAATLNPTSALATMPPSLPQRTEGSVGAFRKGGFSSGRGVGKAECDTLIYVAGGEPIETSRLRLELLTPKVLEMLLERDIDGASRAQGVVFTEDFLLSVNDLFLTRQLEGVRKRSLTPGWSARLVLRKSDDRLLGHCGFHGAPEDVGRAEIGYTIFAPYRRRGYASEATQGLVDWAREQQSTAVYAAVSPDNSASLGVVARVGFRRVGIQGKDGDHEEYVFELSL